MLGSRRIPEEHINSDGDPVYARPYLKSPLCRFHILGDVHTNTVESAFSLLKRGIMGTWHKVSAKHLPAYLDEMCFRFNNRKNQFLFRDTLIKLILSPNLEYKDLTANVQDAA